MISWRNRFSSRPESFLYHDHEPAKPIVGWKIYCDPGVHERGSIKVTAKHSKRNVILISDLVHVDFNVDCYLFYFWCSILCFIYRCSGKLLWRDTYIHSYVVLKIWYAQYPLESFANQKPSQTPESFLYILKA